MSHAPDIHSQMACPPCTGACNQGRTCPSPAEREQRPPRGSGVGLVVVLAAVAVLAFVAGVGARS